MLDISVFKFRKRQTFIRVYELLNEMNKRESFKLSVKDKKKQSDTDRNKCVILAFKNLLKKKKVKEQMCNG